MEGEWLSAIDALTRVAAATGTFEAISSICTRAHAGLIEAKAMHFVLDGHGADDVMIPKQFWWAEGQSALEQNWKAGDFETWIDQTMHMQAFGVSFSRSGIEVLVAPSLSQKQASADSTNHPGGRPAAAWWDDLWIEICRQLWAGELNPKRQSHIEVAMMDRAVAQGHYPAQSTIRTRATKLWAVLSQVEN